MFFNFIQTEEQPVTEFEPETVRVAAEALDRFGSVCKGLKLNQNTVVARSNNKH